MTCLQLHQKLGELTRRVAQLTPLAEQAKARAALIDAQALTIGSLREQLDTAKNIRATVNAKAGRYDDAETRAQAAERMLAEQTKELVALRSFRDNVNSVSTLPRHQAPVAPPADRFETGTPVRLGASPMAVTDSGQASVMPDGFNADTQPIPLAVADEPELADEIDENHPDYAPNPPYDLPEGDWR
jgi:hypothetical protein